MLLIWAWAIIQVYMAVNKWNHWHKTCANGGAVPISTIANRATSCSSPTTTTNSGIREKRWTKNKMKLCPSTFRLWGACLLHKRDAQQCTLHRVVYIFPTAATTTVISSPSTSGSRLREKISSTRRTQNPIHHVLHRLHARLAGLSTELSRGLNPTASNPIRSNFWLN